MIHETGKPNDNSWKTRAFAFYERHEVRLAVAFFLGGFVFDVFTLSDIDDPWALFQQAAYLVLIGGLLIYDFLHGEEATIGFGPAWAKRAWGYRTLALHFLLGSLYSVYSLFFLKSASLFSSMIFVVLLMGIMVANELPAVQSRKANTKLALYVVCVFCFFSLIFPILLGHVGRVPFFLSLAATVGYLGGIYWILRGRVGSILLRRRLLAPGLGVAGVFALFYVLGWIPPVPLSATKIGLYHRIEKTGGDYVVYHERPWWKFWHGSDQDFRAEPGDKLNLFVSVFSPARFDDQVFLHWYWKNPATGWQSTDRIPMRVTGGRAAGYRGTAVKANYTDGEFRVSVETNDGREIGRMYFTVTKVEAAGERVFQTEVY